MRRSFAILAVLLVGGVSTLLVRAQDRPAVFTAEQAAAGRIEVEKNSFGDCTACHTTALTGRHGDPSELPPLSSLKESDRQLILGNGGNVPPLAGPGFIIRWGRRSTKDLNREFEERFAPPSGRLTPETRLDLIAFFLQSSGAVAGSDSLTLTTDVEIRTLTR
jgi:hypothetical protein